MPAQDHQITQASTSTRRTMVESEAMNPARLTKQA
jgi:hypothetical protein